MGHGCGRDETRGAVSTHSIPVDHRDSDAGAHYGLEIFQELRVDPVSGVVEGGVDLVTARGGVVDVDADGILDLGSVEVVDPGLWRDIGVGHGPFLGN